MKYLQRLRQSTITNQIMSVSSTFMMIGTIALAAFGGFQYCTSRNQLSAMQNMIDQNERLIKASSEQANASTKSASVMESEKQAVLDSAQAARDSAVASKNSANATKDIVSQNERLIAAAQTQANASSRQADVALRQLEVADRPWLEVRVIPAEGLSYNVNGANLSFEFTVLNVGRSAAVNATIQARLVLADKVLRAQQTLCGNVSQYAIAYPVFPNARYVQVVSLTFNRDDMKTVLVPNLLTINLVGCVDYQFLGQSTHHQTGFIYDIQSDKGSIPIGEELPRDRIRLRTAPWGNSFYAN